MKKILYLSAATFILSIAAFNSQAATAGRDRPTKEAIAAMSPEQKQALAAEIKQRLDEIKAMDKSLLTRPEKRELRAELRSLKEESNDTGINKTYIYGAGVVALIIILLIIF
jgi:hypothetical protein